MLVYRGTKYKVLVYIPAWDIDGGSRLGMYDGGGQGGGFRAEPPPIARAAKKMACFGDFKGHFH